MYEKLTMLKAVADLLVQYERHVKVHY